MTEPPRPSTAPRGPVRKGFLTREETAWELGISRRTLARTLKADPSFPRFFALTPGVFVIARADFDAWLEAKVTRSRLAQVLGAR